jgi:hypothetical protein
VGARRVNGSPLALSLLVDGGEETFYAVSGAIGTRKLNDDHSGEQLAGRLRAAECLSDAS